MIFFFQAEDGIRYSSVTGVQTCALPISPPRPVIAAYMPSARVRSFPSGKVTAISDRPAGAATAAPTPRSQRAGIRTPAHAGKPPSPEAGGREKIPALNTPPPPPTLSPPPP